MFSENQFCSLSVGDLLRLTPWVFWSEIFTRRSSLCLLSFGLDLSLRFVPQDWQWIFYWSLPELKGRFVPVWNCLIFCVRQYSSLWPEICRVLSRIQWGFLRGISGKNYFGRIFQKFSLSYPLPKFVKFRPTFYNFYFASVLRWKKFTQVLSYVVCTQVRRHIHKRITKRRYREEKPGHFVFRKPVFFTLGLGLTTPYSLGVFVWNFYQTFVTVSIEFWLRFEPPIRPTRLEINFLLITVRAERKVRSCLKLFWFFFVGQYSSVWPEICRVLSRIQWRF